MSSAFFDVRVFNSHAPSNCKKLSAACYHEHEMEERRAYERRIIDVDHDTFTPIVVLSTSGGCGPSASVAFRRLTSLLSDKWAQPYWKTLWLIIRCRMTVTIRFTGTYCVGTMAATPVWLTPPYQWRIIHRSSNICIYFQCCYCPFSACCYNR